MLLMFFVTRGFSSLRPSSFSQSLCSLDLAAANIRAFGEKTKVLLLDQVLSICSLMVLMATLRVVDLTVFTHEGFLTDLSLVVCQGLVQGLVEFVHPSLVKLYSWGAPLGAVTLLVRHVLSSCVSVGGPLSP